MNRPARGLPDTFLLALALVVPGAGAQSAPNPGVLETALRLRAEGRDRQARDGLLAALLEPAAGDECAATLAWRFTQPLGDWEVLQQGLERAATPPGRTPAASFLDRLRVLRLEAALVAGDARRAEALTRELGFLQDLWLIGPFDNERGAGLKRTQPPEQGLDLKTPVEGKKRPVRWRRMPVAFAHGGRIDLDALVRPNDQVLCYAATVVHSQRAQDALLRLGSDEAFAVFVNGAKVAERDLRRRFAYDQDAIPLRLQAGANLLLLKVCDQEGEFGFAARLTALDGSALAEVRVQANEDDIAEAVRQQPATTEPGPSALYEAQLEREVERTREPLEAMRLAFLLLHKQPDDPSRRRDHALAQLAASARPTDPDARFLLAETRIRPVAHQAEKEENPRRHDYEELLAQSPDHVPALLALARMELESVGAARTAERLCRRALERAPGHGPARALLARALERLGLESLVERELQAAAGDPATLALAATRAERRGQPARAAELQAAALRAEATAPRAQKLVELLLRSGREPQALETLALARTLWPFEKGPLQALARLHENQGDTEAAAKAWSEWLTICPEDDAALVELARVRALRGEVDLQRELLRQALELNPNLKDQRRQLEFLEADEKPFYAPFELDGDAVIAADAGPPADAAAHNDPLHYLLHQAVVIAYRGGTSSEYHHTIQRILTEEGARRRSSFRARFWSGEQRARLLLARVVQKDGRVLRPRLQGAYVELPQLAPGDLVELRWRIDDLAPTFFGDTFGYEHSFAPDDGAPCRRSELVLLLEPGREYRTQSVNGAPEAKPVTEAGGRQVHRYALPEVARAVVEERKPGRKETEPLVRVTTYRDWDHLCAWWWHLIRDQIEVSPAMRAKVSELTNGLATEREKIAAIHKFVTTEVRYTAWEFGVHGYKPYSTPVIFERRHGDCKDKALLLQAMLGELGIAAHPVIIHADPLRPLDDLSLPLVAHFNHCISFLPASGDRPAMFLDGTAIYHDVDTIPDMDQGARVLVVKGERGELREVPWVEADQNRDERELTVELQANGDAMVTLEQRPRRNAAVPVREDLGNEPAKQKEKLERTLARWFGKVEIGEVTTSDLLDLNVPVQVRANLLSREFATRRDGVLWIKGSFEPNPLAAFARAEQRELPLLLGEPRSEVRRLRYRLPAGYAPDALPEPIDIDARFGSFHVRWTRTAEELVVERSLVLKIPRIETTEYPEFRAFAQSIEQADRQLVALRVKENGR